jgi:hypothetical protein
VKSVESEMTFRRAISLPSSGQKVKTKKRKARNCICYLLHVGLYIGLYVTLKVQAG